MAAEADVVIVDVADVGFLVFFFTCWVCEARGDGDANADGVVIVSADVGTFFFFSRSESEA